MADSIIIIYSQKENKEQIKDMVKSMVEIEMLKTDNTLGKKGAYIRKFLTEDEYSSMLQKQEEHLIKIKRQAIVQKGTLRYIPLPDRLDSRRKRDIF